MGSLFLNSKKNWNKIWLSKHGIRSVVAERTIKVLYCIFSCDGIAVQISVLKGKSVTRRYYRDVIVESSRNMIINDALCQDLGMFYYLMIMLHHIHLNLCSNF